MSTSRLRALRAVARRAGTTLSSTWAPYTKLFLIGEGAAWVIDQELRALAAVARGLDVEIVRRWPPTAASRQCLFYGSHFTLFDQPPTARAGHRIATTYFHGRPGTAGMPEFDAAFAALRSRHREIERIQVSHRELEEVVLASGIEPSKVFRIPIGVEPRYFHRHSQDAVEAARRGLGIPGDAFVVGSFQKDGVGWAEGLEPKPIKGPDVLVESLSLLRERVPELHVLLSGPARGYVKSELDRRRIAYTHRFLDRYESIGTLYAALDAYVVPSRQEGGPKGVLESMAAGVPIVSTRVGQATDLIRDGENGWLVDVEDVGALRDRLAAVATATVDVAPVVAAGLVTARENSYDAQVPLWRSFFEGFVGS